MLIKLHHILIGLIEFLMYIYIYIYIYISRFVHLESVLPSMFAYGTHKRIKTKVTKCNSEITGIKK